ncbi:MAG: cation transporter [Bacteroidetes bacterium]|nr:cation transporter [Bacteroidota bacterium]
MSVIPSVVNYLYSLRKSGRDVTIEMKVWGNCGKCKARIEKAAKIKGVKKAKWDIDTKMLTVIFNPKLIKLEQIHENIASVGHDTEELYTKKNEYRKLPECCKYKRE